MGANFLNVFISYTSEDSHSYLDLCERMDESGIGRWDVRKLSVGKTLGGQLRQAIHDCDVCVFIATPKSVKSEWCLAEVGAFWGANKPVLVFTPGTSAEFALPPQFLGDLCARELNQVIAAIKEYADQAVDKPLEFRKRSQLPQLETLFTGAREVVLVGPSLISIAVQGQSVFEKMVAGDCSLKFVLLDPKDNDALTAYNRMTRNSPLRQDIERVIERNLKPLSKLAKRRGQIEVRLLTAIPTFSVMAVDPDNLQARMIVEMHGYKSHLAERGHLFIERVRCPGWHAYFYRAVENLLTDSKLIDLGKWESRRIRII